MTTINRVNVNHDEHSATTSLIESFIFNEYSVMLLPSDLFPYPNVYISMNEDDEDRN